MQTSKFGSNFIKSLVGFVFALSVTFSAASASGAVLPTSDGAEAQQPSVLDEIERLNLLINGIDQDQYIVNSGDTFNIRIWKPGLESSEIEVTVIQGKIFLEMIGDVELAGFSLRQAVDRITNNYEERFSQFRVHVTLSSMRVFNVIIAGEVNKPGFYQVNPLTRLSNLLELAGGTTNIGSGRSVRISDSEGSSKNYDLFSFGDSGDVSRNPLIREGDSVFVPVRYGIVTVAGEVLKPGAFEIVEGNTLFSLLDFFKGISPGAYREKLVLQRPSASAVQGEGRYAITTFTWNDLTGDFGKKTVLQDGDILNVQSTVEKEFVIVQGLVVNPGQYLFMKGMRVTDLLNAAGGLQIISDNASASTSNLSGKTTTTRVTNIISISGLYKVMLERVDRQTGHTSHLFIDLADLLILNDSTQNIELMPGDVLSIATHSDMVYVHGMVAQGGFFPYDPNNTVRDYIFLAGGPQKDGDMGHAKLTRDGSTIHADINTEAKPGDTIYIPPGRKYTIRDTVSFVSNLVTFYLMIDKILER